MPREEARKPATDGLFSLCGVSTRDSCDTRRLTVADAFTYRESSDTTGMFLDTSSAAIAAPSSFPRTRMAISAHLA